MGINPNHKQTVIRIVPGREINHNQTIAPIRIVNHNQTITRPEFSIRIANHNQTLVRG